MASYRYFADYALNQATYEIEKSIDIITHTLDSDLSDLYFDVSYSLDYEGIIVEILGDISHEHSEKYINDYLKIQDLFEQVMHNNDLIKNMVL